MEKDEQMTREEMIATLAKYCCTKRDCSGCLIGDFYGKCDFFLTLTDEELGERIALIEEESKRGFGQTLPALSEAMQEAKADEMDEVISYLKQEAKADAGKAPISLVPMEIVWAIAWIRKYGNEKYGDPDNWKTVEPERYRDALMRHILHYISDPKSVDEESGYPHLWHAACNMAFLMSMDYGGMCHYDFAVKKPEWEKVGREAVENCHINPREEPKNETD